MNGKSTVACSRAALAALALALTGCNAAPPGLTIPAAVEGVTVDLAAAQSQVSTYRHAHGLPPVTIDSELVTMAQRQAEAMASAGRLSHDIDGNLVARLAAAGRRPGAAVENVAAGYESMGAALTGWQHSAMHNANLLDPQMRRLGIAAALAPTTRYKRFWALVMTQ